MTADDLKGEKPESVRMPVIGTRLEDVTCMAANMQSGLAVIGLAIHPVIRQLNPSHTLCRRCTNVFPWQGGKRRIIAIQAHDVALTARPPPITGVSSW